MKGNTIKKIEEGMITGVTPSGFEYALDKSVGDDYEFLELIAEVDENPLLTPMLLKKLLGEEQANRLKEHLRKDGKVSTVALANEIAEILKGSSAKK